MLYSDWFNADLETLSTRGRSSQEVASHLQALALGVGGDSDGDQRSLRILAVSSFRHLACSLADDYAISSEKLYGGERSTVHRHPRAHA